MRPHTLSPNVAGWRGRQEPDSVVLVDTTGNTEETLEENRAKVLLTGEKAEDTFLHIRTQVGNSKSWRFRGPKVRRSYASLRRLFDRPSPPEKFEPRAFMSIRRGSIVTILAGFAFLLGLARHVQAGNDDWPPIDPAELKMDSEPKAPGAPAIY